MYENVENERNIQNMQGKVPYPGSNGEIYKSVLII